LLKGFHVLMLGICRKVDHTQFRFVEMQYSNAFTSSDFFNIFSTERKSAVEQTTTATSSKKSAGSEESDADSDDDDDDVIGPAAPPPGAALQEQ